MYVLVSRSLQCAVIAAIALCLACIPSEPPEEELPPMPPAPGEQTVATAPPRAKVDVKALQDEWLKLAEDHEGVVWNPRAFEIAAILSQQSPEALRPLIEALADSQDDPYKMVFVVQSLEQFMTMGHRDYLVNLLDSDDGTLRASAARLLASIPDDAVREDLRPLLQDEDPRVQFSARLGLARWEPEIRSALLDGYDDPERTESEKWQIAGIVLGSPTEGDVQGLAAIVADPDTSSFHRVQAAANLGRMGDETVLDELEASLEKFDDAAYQEMAKAAVAAIRQRSASNEESAAKAGQDAAATDVGTQETGTQ